jgi:hypothetical protein
MIRIDYYGVEGAGKTVKEAKLDAGRKIETMLKGDYVPEVIAFRGFVALLWREPYGWFSKLLTDYHTHEIQTGRLNGCASHASRSQALAAIRMSLAQTAWTPDITPLCLDILLPEQYSDFQAWARFQLKYRELKASGLTDIECHRQACEAMYV